MIKATSDDLTLLNASTHQLCLDRLLLAVDVLEVADGARVLVVNGRQIRALGLVLQVLLEAARAKDSEISSASGG